MSSKRAVKAQQKYRKPLNLISIEIAELLKLAAVINIRADIRHRRCLNTTEHSCAHH